MKLRPMVTLASILSAARRSSVPRTIVARGSDRLAKLMVREVRRLGGS